VQEIDFHRTLHRPGTLVDAGAHVGRMTRLLAMLPASRVVAFEPFSPAFRRLAAHVRTERIHNIVLQAVALGASDGAAVLSMPQVAGTWQDEWGSIAKNYAVIAATDPRVEAVQRMRVPVRRLDSFALEDVTAMKIDVEGGEQELIAGAVRTLTRCRPVLSVEIEERHRPGSTRTMPAQLARLGYLGFFELRGEWMPVERFNPTAWQVASPSPASFAVSDPYVFTFYFIPEERRTELARLARLPVS
jgi:FkbM family methyltransferase